MFFEDLLILLIFVWLGRKLFQQLGLPSLFGELLAGIVAGPLVLGWVHETEAIVVLAELGVFFLMFHAGLEFNPKELWKSSKSSLVVAFGSIVASILGAFLIATFFDYSTKTALALGLILSITDVAVLTRIFKDNKLLSSPITPVVITAAVLTEIVVLIVFSVFLNQDLSESFALNEVLLSLLKVALYFVGVFFVGHFLFKGLYRITYQGNKGFTFTVIVALAFAVVAEWIGLHFIIGAFLAGLFLSQELFHEEVFRKIEDRSFGISYSFLAPIFFASLAFHLDFSSITKDPVLLILLILLDVAAKFIGAGFLSRLMGIKVRHAQGIGVAMNCRGAVDLIVATIALEAGLIDAGLYSVIVVAVFVATLLSTLSLKIMKDRLT